MTTLFCTKPIVGGKFWSHRSIWPITKFWLFSLAQVQFWSGLAHTRTELQVKISTGHVKLQVYKHISVLCTSKNISACLTSLCHDLDYTCKLIPKSKPTKFPTSQNQKISSEHFEFKKFLQRAKILALFIAHFPGVL